MRKYSNQILFGILIALAIYIGLLIFADNQGQLDSEGIWEQLQAFPLWLIPVLILCQLFVIGFRFSEFVYFLGVIDARDRISFFDSLLIFVTNLMMVVSPGKAAELVKAVMLKIHTTEIVDGKKIREGVPISRSAPIVIAERVVDGIAVLILMTTTLILAGDKLNLGVYNGIDYDALSHTILYSSSGLILFGLIVIQIRPLAYFFLNLLRLIPLLKRLYQPLVEFYESSREIFAFKHIIVTSMLGVGVYFSSIMGFILVLYGFQLSITWQLILQATFIVGVTSAIGALSFIPNGAGVTEISNAGLLLAMVTPIQPMMTLAMAAAAAFLQGFFHKWFRVLLGLVVAFLYRDRLFNKDLELALRDEEVHQVEASPVVV
jgi:glycosyltransferase 2 family protein